MLSELTDIFVENVAFVCSAKSSKKQILYHYRTYKESLSNTDHCAKSTRSILFSGS